jgi:rhodanese-related sulfurtransferase
MASDRISPKEVYSLFSSGHPFVFVDTRNPKAWAASDVILPNAIRVPVEQVDMHLQEIDRDKTVVTYCT